MINPLLSCAICSLPYNTTSRASILVSCCGDTTCKQCWQQGFIERDGFKCPFNCGFEHNERQGGPKINRAIFKEVERHKPTDLACDSHPGQQVTRFSKSSNKFLCPACPVGDSVEISREALNEGLDALLDKLERRKELIDRCHQKMLAFREQGTLLEASQF